MGNSETLVEAALRVLNTADPFEKARLGDQVANQWLQGFITQPYHPSQEFTVPDRPARLSNARGLDVVPTTISRFRNGGDDQTADLLETVVYPEEITHCAAGVKWFRYLCRRSRNQEVGVGGLTTPQSSGSDDSDDDEVVEKFHGVVRAYFRGPLKPPFNEAARRTAGFGPRWYEPLAVKYVTTNEAER